MTVPCHGASFYSTLACHCYNLFVAGCPGFYGISICKTAHLHLCGRLFYLQLYTGGIYFDGWGKFTSYSAGFRSSLVAGAFLCFGGKYRCSRYGCPRTKYLRNFRRCRSRRIQSSSSVPDEPCRRAITAGAACTLNLYSVFSLLIFPSPLYYINHLYSIGHPRRSGPSMPLTYRALNSILISRSSFSPSMYA